MQRRVLQLGKSTLVVSLPHAWAQRFGISKGDGIDVRSTESGLMISVESKKKHSHTLDITNMHYSLVWYHVTAAYMAGHSSIIIHFKNKRIGDRPTIEVLSSIVQGLIGMEMTMQEDKRCVIEEIVTSRTDEIAKLMARMWSLLGVMAEEKEKDLLSVYESQMNKLVLYTKRVLVRVGAESRTKTLALFTIITQLEVVADLLSKAPKEDFTTLVRLAREAFSTANIAEVWQERKRIKKEKTHALCDTMIDALHTRLLYT